MPDESPLRSASDLKRAVLCMRLLTPSDHQRAGAICDGIVAMKVALTQATGMAAAAARERDEARHALESERRLCTQYQDAVDRVFQVQGDGQPLLPDFLGLGDSKAEGIVCLAESYIDLRERHAVEREAHAKAAVERDTALAQVARLRAALNKAREYVRDCVITSNVPGNRPSTVLAKIDAALAPAADAKPEDNP